MTKLAKFTFVNLINFLKLYINYMQIFIYQLYSSKSGKKLINLLRVDSVGILNTKQDVICAKRHHFYF